MIRHLRIFSDSMLSELDPQKLQNTKVVPISGARIKDVHNEVRKPEYHGSKFKRAVLMTATNNVSDAKGDAETVPDMINQYKDLVKDVKAIAETVSVSSVCPRLDDAGPVVESLNTGLQILCNDVQCEFIDNTPSFTCGDGTTNDGYLVNNKSPHVNKAGLNKLARNLKLDLKDDIKDVSKGPKLKPRPDKRGAGPGRPARGARTPADERDKYSPIQYNRDGCYYCNEGGHNTQDCRHRHQGPLQCGYCGDFGHKMKHHYSVPDEY